MGEFFQTVFKTYLCNLYRVKGAKSKEWIQAISRHQEYDFHTKYFMICEKHFIPSDILVKDGKKKLETNAVPSVFVYPPQLPTDGPLQAGIEDGSSTMICKITNCNYRRSSADDSVIGRSFFKYGISDFFISIYLIDSVNLVSLACRLPKDGPIRSKWTDSISQHFAHDFYGDFVVCDKHFRPADFVEGEEERYLKGGAIPSIFESIWKTNYEFELNKLYCRETEVNYEPSEVSSLESNDTVEKSFCNGCIELNLNWLKANEKISSLERKILELKEKYEKKEEELKTVKKENIELKQFKTDFESSMKVRVKFLIFFVFLKINISTFICTY